jgi:serine/threonine-protein kinase
VSRNGLATTLLATDRPYHNPRVSPNGRRLSLDFTDQVRDVWLFDIADSTLTRFGFDSSAHDAEWLPDGSGLVFAAARGGSIGAFRRRFNAAGRADSVFVGPQQISLHAFTPDGRTGVGVTIENGVFDMVAVGMDGRARYDSVLSSPYNEGWPALSPDGRWLAYQSDESGRNEVYVRAWPTLGGKVQVSQSGGTEPAWSRNGRELFFRSGGGAEPMLVAATFEGTTELRVRSRTPLFSVASYEFATPHRNYDPFPDGQSFAMVRQGRPGQLAEVVYVQNPKALLGKE